jgi:hypothetical protein
LHVLTSACEHAFLGVVAIESQTLEAEKLFGISQRQVENLLSHAEWSVAATANIGQTFN